MTKEELAAEIERQNKKLQGSIGQKIYNALNKLLESKEFVHFNEATKCVEDVVGGYSKVKELTKHHNHHPHHNFSPTVHECKNNVIFVDDSCLTIVFIADYLQEISVGMVTELSMDDLKEAIDPDNITITGEATKSRRTLH